MIYFLPFGKVAEVTSSRFLPLPGVAAVMVLNALMLLPVPGFQPMPILPVLPLVDMLEPDFLDRRRCNNERFFLSSSPIDEFVAAPTLADCWIRGDPGGEELNKATKSLIVSRWAL